MGLIASYDGLSQLHFAIPFLPSSSGTCLIRSRENPGYISR
jgi:hypothetical protein